MKLYERIQMLRKKEGFSQEELAEQLGVSRQTISKWENGVASPGMERLQQLSDLLGVTLNELLGVEADISSNERMREYEEEIKKLKSQKRTQLMLGGGICVVMVIMVILFWKLFDRMGDLGRHVEDLQVQIFALDDTPSEAVSTQVLDFQVQMNGATATVGEHYTLQVSAIPKSYKGEMTAKFTFEGKMLYTAEAIYEDGCFMAEIVIPFEERNLKSAIYLTSDGETVAEYLEERNYFAEYFMEIELVNTLEFIETEAGLQIQGTVDTICEPAYKDMDGEQPKLMNYPVSTEIVIRQDGIELLRRPTVFDAALADDSNTIYMVDKATTDIQELIEGGKLTGEIEIISRVVDNYRNVREVKQVCSEF